MRSKELIEEYIKECDKDGWVEYSARYWKPELQIIHKDLEVLEMLKSKIRISNDLDVRMLDYPLFLLPMTKKERDTIKEWLNNEN